MTSKNPYPEIPVRGELDTAMPVSDRPPGTLVVAKDVSPRFWGPRRGSQAFARVWEGAGGGTLYDAFSLNGSNTKGVAWTMDPQLRNLGTRFTLDLWARLTETTFASGKDAIGLYGFRTATRLGTLDVYITGPAHATPNRVRVEITTSDNSTTDSLVGITGATEFTSGSSQLYKHHIRVVRDGVNAYLYLDGVLDGSTTGLEAKRGIAGPLATFHIGASFGISDTSVTWKGSLYGALLRDGAYRTAPIEARMPNVSLARCVRHYIIGRNHDLNGADHFYDAGRHTLHPKMSGSGSSVTASADNTAPVPSPVQGIRSWTTPSGRPASAVICGGTLFYGAVP